MKQKEQITKEVLKQPSALDVPIKFNRKPSIIEISSDVADSSRSLILDQVK